MARSPRRRGALSERAIRRALRRHPEREGQLRAMKAYVGALPAEVDSLGGMRGCFAEDAHVLFEAFLEVRAEEGGAPGRRRGGGGR